VIRTEDEYVCEILRLEKPLRAYLHRFAPQPADLDDLLQETYSHLFGVPAERRLEVRNVQAFALTSARNVAMDWIRRRRVVPIDLVEDLSALPIADDRAGLEEIVHTHQQLVRVAEGIGKLPERCREVFTLRRVYGLSQKEIAIRLGISEGALEQLLIRGMRACAAALDTPAEAAASAKKSKPVGWLGRWRSALGLQE
jgi:RNA polymerase sigma factor (sigma-70 family)